MALSLVRRAGAAPWPTCEPDPAPSRSQSASDPRACSKAVGEMKARAADATH